MGETPAVVSVAAVAVVPAAGASRRMGRPKLLLPFAGTTVVGGVVAALREAGVEQVALVVAPQDEELARWGEARRLLVAVNPAPERGMLSSVLAGIDALGGAARLTERGCTLLVSPGDLPALAAATVRAVLAALAGGAALAVPSHHGRRGHPLGIAPALVAEIPALDPATGLRELLARHAAAVVEVPVDDPGAVHDVDTPEDYQSLSGGGRPGESAGE